MGPLDAMTDAKASSDKLAWSDIELEYFYNAQKGLANCTEICIPLPNDELWIVTDASIRCPGIAATLYVKRNGILKVSSVLK